MARLGVSLTIRVLSLRTAGRRYRPARAVVSIGTSNRVHRALWTVESRVAIGALFDRGDSKLIVVRSGWA